MVDVQMHVAGGGIESIKLLTSFIQQMHEMKLRNVWPKSPNLKMFIFIFSALDVLQFLRMSIWCEWLNSDRS